MAPSCPCHVFIAEGLPHLPSFWSSALDRHLNPRFLHEVSQDDGGEEEDKWILGCTTKAQAVSSRTGVGRTNPSRTGTKD